MATLVVAIFVYVAGGNRTRGMRGEQGFRIACDEPVNDSAHAGALAGQDGRFPPLLPCGVIFVYGLDCFYDVIQG